MGAWRLVGRRWKRNAGRWFAANQWSLVGGLFVVTFVVGVAGFARQDGAERPGDWMDALYRTLAMGLLEDSPEPPASPAMGAARFLLPLLVAWTAVLALYGAFRDRFRQVLLPLRRGHVVIAGLTPMGVEFVRRYRTGRARVVAVHSEEDRAAEAARAAGALVILGDPTDADVLAEAHVGFAAQVVVATADDRTNVEVALTAMDEASGSRNLRSFLVHLGGPDLVPLLRSGARRAGSGVATFSLHDQAARAFVVRHLGIPGAGTARPLVLVGSSPLLRGVAAEAASRSLRSGDEVQEVTLVADDPQGTWERWCSEVSGLADNLRVEMLPTAMPRPIDGWEPDADAVIVVDAGEDGETLATALGLEPVATAVGATVVACVGLSDSLQAAIEAETATGFTSVEAFDAVASVCSDHLDGLAHLDGPVDSCSVELIAQLVHEEYRRHRLAAVADPTEVGSDASLVPWSRLAEHLKHSNRSQARDIPNKLAAVGCTAVPLGRWEVDDFEFTDEETATVLGPMEHDRWWKEREASRWRDGGRDPARRSSPYMVPWDDLTPEIRQLDINAVAVIPRLMNAAGWKVVRERPATDSLPAL